MNCTDKFLKHSERVGARFAEQNAGVHRLHLRFIRDLLSYVLLSPKTP